MCRTIFGGEGGGGSGGGVGVQTGRKAEVTDGNTEKKRKNFQPKTRNSRPRIVSAKKPGRAQRKGI